MNGERLGAAGEPDSARRPHAGGLPRPPALRLVVLTCMDARIDPLGAFGLELGEAHVLRNAGAVATDDVLRSLAISTRLLGTRQVLVVGHTDCAMACFTNEDLRACIADDGGSAEGVDFLPFADVEASVRESVRRVSESPLLPRELSVSGFLFDVETGRLSKLG
jgi:carbonic anhydrase